MLTVLMAGARDALKQTSAPPPVSDDRELHKLAVAPVVGSKEWWVGYGALGADGVDDVFHVRVFDTEAEALASPETITVSRNSQA